MSSIDRSIPAAWSRRGRASMSSRAAALLAVIALTAHPALAQGTAPAACTSTVTGDLRLHQLKSTTFGNTRTIRVLLPDGYDRAENQSRRYPVLYLLDGQNLFDACLSDVSHREWQVDETVRRLVAERRIPPMIVVGVDHAGRDRGLEYLPYRHFGGPDPREPKGRDFPRFLTSEVLPFVDSTYRTHRGHDNTGIGGSSYGGVATLYALLAAPDVFGYGLMESSSLMIGSGQLVRDTDPLVAMPRRVYAAIGAEEAGPGPLSALLVSLHRRVASNFRSAGYDSTRFRLDVDPQGRHSEDTWARRLPDALVYLFGDWKEPPPKR